MNVLPLLAALAIVAPKDGAVVPTLKEGQKAYFAAGRAERIVRLDSDEDRNRFFKTGSTQRPIKLAWTGETNAVYQLTVSSCGRRPVQEFVVSNRTEVYVLNLMIGAEYKWSVRPVGSAEEATATFRTEDIPPRLLYAGGVSNLRDLGGWKTEDGRRVRQELIFRSAGLRASSSSKGPLFGGRVEFGKRRVTDAGLETLRTDFGIKTDLELRTPQETAGMETTLLGPGVRWACISFAAYDFIDNIVRGREPFAKVFEIFTDKSNYPILMHCSGGRDRTGTLAFLLNGLLGVPEEDLRRDWEASVFSGVSAQFRSSRIQRLVDYLNTHSGRTLREKIESYARGCGITKEEIEAFRAIMLE